jgi:hypothetical protein
MKLGYIEQFYWQIGHFNTQICPGITNKDGRSRAVRYDRILTVFQMSN